MKELTIQSIYECTGVYGIYVGGELVYIGKTSSGFGKRFGQHKYYVDNPEKATGARAQMYYDLAEMRAKGCSVILLPLVIAEYIPYDSKYKLTNRDIESMEMALIWYCRPRYNICGNRSPYKFTK